MKRFTPEELRAEAMRRDQDGDSFTSVMAMLLQAAHDAETLIRVQAFVDGRTELHVDGAHIRRVLDGLNPGLPS